MLGLTHLFKAASRRRHMATASGLLSIALAILAPAHAQTSVQNTATIALPPGATVVDSNPANNTSTATVSVLALPRLTLVKQVVNDNGGTAAASAWTLVATGASTTISGATGTATVTNATIPAGTYALSETAGAAGYAAGTWSCVKNGGAAVSANSISLVGNDVATCTIINNDQAATLTLVKTVINDNGGTATVSNFPLTATGPTTITGVSGTAAVTNASVNAGVYTLSEVTAAGYAAGSWSCTAGTLSGNQLTLANGQSASCSITNNDQAATLTLVKTVINDNGGTATVSNFPLTATGPTTITGVSGTAAVTNASVNAGVYTLSEVTAAGYAAGSWSCTAGTLAGNQLTLANGQSASCSITNNDQAATLTLVKTVINDNGGTATVSNFPLTATGPTTITGVSGTAAVTNASVNAGVYTLSEVTAAGYAAGSWSCTAGTLAGNQLTLANGQSASCSITNNDQSATLTLVKTVINDNGGTATVSNFPLTATGPTTITGVSGTAAVTNASVNAGVYTLSEVTAAGYAAGSWSCTAGTLTGNQLTLVNGQSASCSITNNDQAATLTLVKTVINDNGGTATVSNFPLTATGPTTITGVSGTAAVTNASVNAGVYTLSEVTAAGYAAGSWSCTAGTLSGNQLTLANGQSASCSITNNDQSATLTLVKTVINDNGGTATVSNFPLTATGPTTITGVSGTAAVTNASVNAGVYTLSEVTAAGYAAGSWSCTAGTLAGNQLTLANGQSASCSITNNDQSATLTLVKTVINDNGGTATVSNFPLTATGPTTITGVSGTAAVTNASVNAGVYTLSEVTAAGYAAGSWSCTAGTLSGNQLTLANGQSASCAITNNDQSATLTLVKTVVNTGGGTATATSWTLAATGPTSISGAGGATGQVSAGSYVLSESAGPADYVAGGWSCTAGTLSGNQLTLANGQSATCTITNTFQAAPALTIDKSTTTPTYASVGQVLSYSYLVTNSGNTTITSAITVSDDRIASVTCPALPAGGLAPTQSITCTATYTVTQADLDAGTVTNIARASDGTTTSPPDTVTVTATQTPSQTLVKALTNDSTGGAVAVGDELTYTVTMTNTGNTTLTGVVVSDALITPNSTTCASVAPGATCQLVGVYTVTQADADAGNIRNTAVVTSPVCPVGSTDPACTTTIDTPVPQTPSQTLVKALTNDSTGGAVAVGDELTYTVTMTNTGNTTLTGVVVSDALITPNSTTCASVAPGATCQLVGVYTVTQADADAGNIRNTAVVTSPVCPVGSTDPACTTTIDTPVPQTPSQTLVKALTNDSTGGAVAVGDELTYTVTMTNTGNTTLTGVVVSDALITPNSTTCASVAPGATCQLVGVYTVTQADADAGNIRNTAVVTSPVCPVGSTDPACTTTIDTPVPQTPSQTLVKALTNDSTGGAVAVGDELTYTVTMTNTGNTTLTGVVVSDALITPNSTTCASVAPGATCQLVGVYTVTQADADAGNIRNTAVVTSPVCPVGSTDPACTTTIDTPVPQTPSQTLVKALTNDSTGGAVAVGDELTYTVTMTNTGNTTLTGVVVSDALITPNSTTCASVAPGATCQLVGVYTVTQADADAGNIRNTAVVTSPVCPVGSTDPACTTTIDTPVPQTPSQTLVKALTNDSTGGAVAVGDELTYTVTMTNTGNTTLTGVVVSDALITPNSTTCASVAPGATCQLVGVYTVTQADADAGNIRNTAVVTSPVCPVGSTDPACTTTIDTPVPQTPSQTLVKALTNDSTGGAVAVGDELTYTVTMTNTGNTTLTGVVVSDALITPNSTTCASVAPGATCQLVGVYTVTQADADAGNIRNTAVVTSPVCPVGSTDPACTTTIDTPVPQTPSQTLVKALTNDSTGGAVAVGDELTYTVTMTNTGNTTLTGVVVSDALITPNSTTCASVAPGATCQLVGVYTVTQADADAGNIRNTAVVTSPVCPVGSTDPACTTTIDTPVVNPVVTYAKSVALPIGQTEVSTGDTLTYTLNVQISAAATTSVVILTDTLGTGLTLATVSAGSFSCGTANPLVCTLPAGTAPGTYSVSYTVIVNDQATGTVTNTVVGVGDDAPTCAGTCRTETPVTEPLPPLVTYAKSAVLPTGRSEVAVGDSITYTLTTNVINAVTTADVVLTDTLGAGLTFGTVTDAGAYAANTSGAPVLRFTLPAGTTPGTYVVSYTAVVNPAARGTVNNAVVGAGNDAPTCAGSCDTSSPVAEPRVTVSKSSNPATGTQVQVGQTVRYTLSVDVGVSALTGELVLVDTPDRGLTLGALPAGCSFDGTVLTCRLPAGTTTGLHALSYDAVVNANAGTVVGNQVVATGGGGETPLCTACSTEHQLDTPEIRLSKTAGSREVRIGDLVRYTLTIENVGAMDLVGGSVVDTPAAGFSYVEGSLVANDADGMATVSGGSPLRFSGVDVAAGQTATLVYVMRVGAGVRPGTHVNQAQVRSATDDPVSNIATAEVQLTADPLLDDSLLFGTVFNDRDGDGWQDSAALSGVKVQGGFAPTAYIANSTTVDRGAGPQPEADASSPLLHGIAVGAISGRQSVADPVEQHTVVIRQHLSEPAFTDDFVLTSAEGVTVRMDAAGNTTVQTSGDAAKGLTAAAPTVERRVAQGDKGYVVDYIIRNAGIDERGIPGVRIASVEGLLIETDQFGRYHLAGVPGGAWERGRNFILKVDPSTLPAGAEFTTDNPLLRRITPGVPVRFDWGVKLPEQVIEGGSKQVELEMGEVFFAPGSAEVREKYLPVIEAMAAKVREYQGGEVVIHANGDSEGLAFDRANAVKAALLGTLDAASAKGLVVSVRGTVDDPSSMIVGVDEGGALLGTVLFDTDKSAIKPAFEPLLDKVAAALEKMGGGSIAIVGHTDVRASHAYNVALGMRRAKAVYEALAKRLSPEVRAKVRVETSNDPTAPVGVRK